MKKLFIPAVVLATSMVSAQEFSALGVYDFKQWTAATGTKVAEVGEVFKLKWLKPEIWTLAGYSPANPGTGYLAGAVVNRFELNTKTTVIVGGAWGFDSGKRIRGGIVLGISIKL